MVRSTPWLYQFLEFPVPGTVVTIGLGFILHIRSAAIDLLGGEYHLTALEVKLGNFIFIVGVFDVEAFTAAHREGLEPFLE